MAAITGIIAFTPGTAALASEVNSNFGKIVSEVNGNLNAANLADGAVTNPKIAAGIDAVKLGAGNISNTELGYLDGVTSPIQTQLNARVPTSRTITAGTGLTGGGDLSADRTLSIAAGGVGPTQLASGAVGVNAPVFGADDTTGTHVSAGSSVLIPAGIWYVTSESTSESAPVVLQVYLQGNWRNLEALPQTYPALIISDGSNVRASVGSGSDSGRFYLRRAYL